MPRPQAVTRFSRRSLVRLGAAAVVGGLIQPGAALGQWRRTEATLDYDPPAGPTDLGLGLSPTGACATEGRVSSPTIRQTEGPFYTPDTPFRSDFSGDGEGRPLVLVGRVISTDCRPLPNAALDFWHADSNGRYDNDGHRFRGHQFADRAGAYRLITIRPSGYGYASAARPPHIHVKVQSPAGTLLTTQLYFPDEANEGDRIFREGLLMELVEEEGVLVGRFDFVLADA